MKTIYILLLKIFSKLALGQNNFITQWNLTKDGSGDIQLSLKVTNTGTAS